MITFDPRAAAQDLEERAGGTEDTAPGAIARRDLERYYTLLRRSLPKYSVAEARVLLNGLMLTGVYAVGPGGCTWPTDRAPLWAHVADEIRSTDRHHREAEHSIAESAERAGLEFKGLPDPLLGVDAEAFI